MTTINTLTFAVQMAIMFLFPIGLALYFHQRYKTPGRIFFIAAGFYLLNLVVQAPFTFYLWPTLFAKLPWVLLAFTTFTYGICEETMRYLSFRTGKTMKAHRDASSALLAGTGHGGTESFVFALQAALIVLTALLAPRFLAHGVHPADVLDAPWWTFILSGLQRVLAITWHLGFATLIVLAYRRSWLFYPLAIVVHFLGDFTTMGIGLFDSSMVGYWWSLLVFALWAVAAVILLVFVRRRALAAPQVSAQAEDNPSSVKSGAKQELSS